MMWATCNNIFSQIFCTNCKTKYNIHKINYNTCTFLFGMCWLWYMGREVSGLVNNSDTDTSLYALNLCQTSRISLASCNWPSLWYFLTFFFSHPSFNKVDYQWPWSSWAKVSPVSISRPYFNLQLSWMVNDPKNLQNLRISKTLFWPFSRFIVGEWWWAWTIAVLGTWVYIKSLVLYRLAGGTTLDQTQLKVVRYGGVQRTVLADLTQHFLK